MHEFMVKSIHDQKMHQFMIEAERARLLRQVRQARQAEAKAGWLAATAKSLKQTLTRRPQPAV